MIPGVGFIPPIRTHQPIWPPEAVYAANLIGSRNIGDCSVRIAIPVPRGGSQVRVTYKAGSSGLAIQNVSIAIQSAPGSPNAKATPFRLLFNGVGDYNLTANQSKTSDWHALTFLETDVLLLIADIESPATIGPRALANAEQWYKSNANSYNLQTVTGYTKEARRDLIAMIEAQ